MKTRIVIADDTMLIREGTARLLEDAGFEIVGKADDATKLLRDLVTAGFDVASFGESSKGLEDLYFAQVKA